MLFTLLTGTFLFVSSSFSHTIAIQPFGSFDSTLLAQASPVISAQFDSAQIIILHSIKMPSQAYYPARNRYRAEILLSCLDSISGNKYDKVLGLTSKDISTTKGEYQDWGIFGLGSISGAPCIASTFRLHKNVSDSLFMQRFNKVVVHELGHTLGLYHCSISRCIMADYQGSIKSLDATELLFCPRCITVLAAAFGHGK